MNKNALISDCGNYRYWLLRQWTTERQLNCVMLNPSTADAKKDDATIRRLIGFADRKGYGAIMVYNLFAYRATRPLVLEQVADPVGPDNNYWLSRIRGPVLCAWGNVKWEDREARVIKMLKAQGCELLCLGRSILGHPKHPVRMGYEEATWEKFDLGGRNAS